MLGKVEGRWEEGDRGWNGWVASPMQWTWVSVVPRRWWRAGRPGMLQSTRSPRVSNWTTTTGESTVMIGVVVAAAFTYLGPALLIRLAINSRAQWPWRPRVSRDSIGALPGLVGYRPWFFLLPRPYFPKPDCTTFPEILWITQYPF